MSYLVLARKYRPRKFSDIIGQEHITKALANSLIRGRLPHALLFTGSRGVGKTTSARVIAKALNCIGRDLPVDQINEAEGGSVEPCGECSNCVEIDKGSSLAVFEIDGASNNSVDDVRELIDTLYTSPPPNVSYKIYIIDEVHMLSTAAFNALLKSLEEPPKNTIFIFATTEPHKIPETVLSRCQQHDFRRVPVLQLVIQLKKIAELENIRIEDSVLQLIAKRADGGVRDATTLLDRVSSCSDGIISYELVSQVLGAFDVSHFVDIFNAVLQKDSSGAIQSVSNAFNSNIDVKSYLGDFLSFSRLVALFSLAKFKNNKALDALINVEQISDVEVEYFEEISSNSSTEVLSAIFDETRTIVDQAIKSEYPRYVLEAGIIKLCNLTKLISIDDIIQKLDLLVKHPNTSSARINLETDSKKKSSENLTSNSSESFKDNISDIVWQDFISYLKSSKEVRLDAYMRRVAPTEFKVDSVSKIGTLKMHVSPFEFEAFKDNENIVSLKKRLSEFSKIDNWIVDFDLHENYKNEGSNEKPVNLNNNGAVSGSKPGKELRSRPQKDFIPGSYQASKEERRLKYIAKVESEAKKDVAVKTILDEFKGSKIERIVPLGKNTSL